MKLQALISGAFVLFLVLVATIGFAWAIGAEYNDAPEETYEVLDENLTADVGTWKRVDAPEYALSWKDNETVTNDGTTLTEGTDYEFNATEGTITFFSTADVSDGDTVQIDYYYDAKIKTARSLKTILAVPVRYVLPFSLLIVVAVSIAGTAVALVRWSGTGSATTKHLGRGR